MLYSQKVLKNEFRGERSVIFKNKQALLFEQRGIFMVISKLSRLYFSKLGGLIMDFDKKQALISKGLMLKSRKMHKRCLRSKFSIW